MGLQPSRGMTNESQSLWIGIWFKNDRNTNAGFMRWTNHTRASIWMQGRVLGWGPVCGQTWFRSVPRWRSVPEEACAVRAETRALLARSVWLESHVTGGVWHDPRLECLKTNIVHQAKQVTLAPMLWRAIKLHWCKDFGGGEGSAMNFRNFRKIAMGVTLGRVC